MLNEKYRIIIFLIGCIGIRSILAILPLYLSTEWFQIFGIITMIIGISFLYLYFSNGRMEAPEGGGVTWWAKYRLIHGLLYINASIYLLQKERSAWIPLTIDLLFGLSVFILNKLDKKGHALTTKDRN